MVFLFFDKCFRPPLWRVCNYDLFRVESCSTLGVVGEVAYNSCKVLVGPLDRYRSVFTTDMFS